MSTVLPPRSNAVAAQGLRSGSAGAGGRDSSGGSTVASGAWTCARRICSRRRLLGGVLDGGGVLEGGIVIIASWLIAGRVANDRGAAHDDVRRRRAAVQL
jgi:hypothetical protein